MSETVTANKDNDLKYRRGMMSEKELRDSQNQTIMENQNSKEKKIEYFTE